MDRRNCSNIYLSRRELSISDKTRLGGHFEVLSWGCFWKGQHYPVFLSQHNLSSFNIILHYWSHYSGTVNKKKH